MATQQWCMVKWFAWQSFFAAFSSLRLPCEFLFSLFARVQQAQEPRNPFGESGWEKQEPYFNILTSWTVQRIRKEGNILVSVGFKMKDERCECSLISFLLQSAAGRKETSPGWVFLLLGSEPGLWITLDNLVYTLRKEINLLTQASLMPVNQRLKKQPSTQ